MPAGRLWSMFNRALGLMLGSLLFLQVAAPAWAWGRLGHRVVTKLAEHVLSPEAKAAVAELLEPGESLADASTWADKHKNHGGAAWHYANVPIREPRYDDRLAGEGQVVPRIPTSSRRSSAIVPGRSRNGAIS